MKRILLAIVLVRLLTLSAFGQATTGAVSGTIKDATGAAVAGARAILKSNTTGLEHRTTSGDQGAFVFSQVAPGAYSLAVESADFKQFVAQNVVVDVAKQTSLTVGLEIGQTSTTVTVEASAVQEMLNTASPTLTTVIETRQVRDLPIGGTDVVELTTLQAGVAVLGASSRTAMVGGLRGASTYITQDGINAMDNFVKTDSFNVRTAPSLNSIGELSITTGTVGSDAGRGVGQLRLVTTGGTNDFHGSVWYLMRNSALEANNFFNNSSGTPRPDEHQHYFGLTAGGPLLLPEFAGGKRVSNGPYKSFWFFSYEGFRENFGATRNHTVLTPEARSGLFRYNGSNGALQSLDLLSIGSAHALNPITGAQLNAMPVPNNTLLGDGLNTSGYRFNVLGSDPNDKFVGRYDQQLVEKSKLGSHKLEFVVNRGTFSNFPDISNNNEAPFPGGVSIGQASTRWLMTAALHSTFGNVTNEFRWGRHWGPVGFPRQSAPTAPFFITLASTSNYDNTVMSQGRETKVSQIIDNFAYSKGRHIMRMGGDFEQIYTTKYDDFGYPRITIGTNAANPNGILNSQFPNLPSGSAGTTIVNRAINIYNDLTGFLGSARANFNVTGPASGFVPGATQSRQFRQRDLALYGEDQWRARRNLTLSYGVRWEFEGVPAIPNGLAIQVTNVNDIFGISGPGNLFNPNAATGAAPAKATLDFVSGKTGKQMYKNDWNNFAPFFGFAFSPDFKSGFLHSVFGSQGSSSVRGGYSISYLHDGLSVISNALGNANINPGLSAQSANTTPTGVLTAAGVSLVTPTFKMPVTDVDNFTLSTNNGLWAINPNIRVPYVQQWSFGYERAITRNLAFEIRYLGNHAIKTWRANDYNEVNIFENGFLQEFLNAQKNLAINGGASFAGGAAGTAPLPILSTLFTGLSSSNGFASSGFINNLNNNNMGTMAGTLANSNTYKDNRALLPANFFVANPNASFIRLLDNTSMSNYHSLQVEVRRRFARGLQLQGDYTFAKALSDAAVLNSTIGDGADLAAFRTLRNRRLDYRRADGDQTHRFVFNTVYDLPIGSNVHLLGNTHGILRQVVDGWTLGSIVTWQTSPAFFVASNRTTFNSFNPGLNPAQLAGIAFNEFKSNLGVFRRPEGVYFVNPNLLDIVTDPATGKLVSSQLKPGLLGVPAPGTFGNFPMNSLTGPRYFNTDLSLVKRFPVNERLSVELKTTMINAFNHPSFIYSTQNFDATTFGLINSQRGNSRIVHFTLTTRW